jgi:hypothetical protein
MRFIAVLGVLFVLASCSDSDMEFKCGGWNDTYHMTLSADKKTLTVTHSYAVYTLYYAIGGKDDLGGFRTYQGFDDQSIVFRTDTESFSYCERIN